MSLTSILFLGTALFLAIFARGEEPWQKIENDYFTFSLPSGFKKTEARGKDSFVEEYVAEGMLVRFDYGKYSNRFGGWPPRVVWPPFRRTHIEKWPRESRRLTRSLGSSRVMWVP